uniref:Neuropathy target esterase sws n=1 Tax=Xenopsylla cheopis TaxID=163159 RepID=A0A6M2DEI5_XENCH
MDTEILLTIQDFMKMDILPLLVGQDRNFSTIILDTWLGGALTVLAENTAISCFVIFFCACIVISFLYLNKVKHTDMQPMSAMSSISLQNSSLRFRKRDKMLYYGRRMLRKVKSISGHAYGGQGKKRKIVMRFARRLLQLQKDYTPVHLKVLEPPAEYLEEEKISDVHVPPDALYMLQSIRVFGHFDKPVFLRLCKHVEIVSLKEDEFLFQIGDADENVYVVQSGLLNVTVTSQESGTLSLKYVRPGDSVTSLLSFTDWLTGHPNPYKTISAVAMEPSQVIKLPMSAFQDIFKDSPDRFVRVMQVIMVRLQRVTFTALHQYLGLSSELITSSSSTGGRRKISHLPTAGFSPGSHRLTRQSTRERTDYHEQVTSQSRISRIPSDWHEGYTHHRLSMSGPEHMPNLEQLLNPTLTSNDQGAATTDTTPTATLSPQEPPVVTGDTSLGTQDSLPQQPTCDAEVMRVAIEGIARELGLSGDRSLLEGRVEVRDVSAGTVLMREESAKEIGLIYVMSGHLTATQRPLSSLALANTGPCMGGGVSMGTQMGTSGGSNAGTSGTGGVPSGPPEVHMFSAYTGEMIGGLAVLTGEPSFFNIKAKHSSKIAIISKTTCYTIMRERPHVVLHISHSVVKRLTPFVRQVDFALDWQFIESGRAVYRQGDESDSTYIVLSGRVRSVIKHENGKKELVGEYGKGDMVGIVEMVSGQPRGTTVMAIRDSELAKLPEGLFNAIKLKYPIVVSRLISLLGQKIMGTWQNPQIHRPLNTGGERTLRQQNFSTVALVPVSDDVPLTAFAYELYHSLCAIGPTLRLTSEVMRKTLGAGIMDANSEYRLSGWLAQQEDQHRMSLYQCDNGLTPWTQRCVRQADIVLIVGLGERAPSVGKIEKEIERLAMRTQKELVLLHREVLGAPCRPQNTVAWLNMRNWVSSHHHIQCPKRMFTRKSQYRINELYSKVLMSEPNLHSDFSRLARWLTGTSVGLVLGGGGARGAAHVGMVRAIQEAGIPIDMVGGVSIGSFIGALWCSEKNITTVTQKAREWARKTNQWWRTLLDLTYPITSMFSGRDFNQTIRGTFGDTHIEDLWLPFFTLTTDLTDSCMRVHRHGSLWRYVRASMSLSGYMPPLCDPADGHLLMDGGYVNNLPADVMRAQGAHSILAIDVGSQDDTDLTDYGDNLSGWWLLWKRWNPFTEPVKVPNLPDIQSRLAYVSCVRQLEEVKASDYCEYLRPPIDRYKTLQFGSFDEIKDVGYRYGKAYFDDQRKSGALPKFRTGNTTSNRATEQTQPEFTFTDLAQMMCQVPRSYHDSDTSSSDDEYEEGTGYRSEPSGRSYHSTSSTRRALSENELEDSESEYA